MTNLYISRYSTYETHFARTDKFTGASFDDDNGESIILRCIASVGLLAVLVTLLFVAVA